MSFPNQWKNELCRMDVVIEHSCQMEDLKEDFDSCQEREIGCH